MADIHALERTDRSTMNPLIQGSGGGTDTVEHCAAVLAFVEAAAGAHHDNGIQGDELEGLCWIMEVVKDALRAAQDEIEAAHRKEVRS